MKEQNTEFIRNRITELRLKHKISENKMSRELGYSSGYIQSISSGNSIPSMHAFLEILDYFEITPIEFFDASEKGSLVREATEIMERLNMPDVLIAIELLKRLDKK